MSGHPKNIGNKHSKDKSLLIFQGLKQQIQFMNERDTQPLKSCKTFGCERYEFLKQQK